MNFDELTDADIGTLLAMPKTVANPKARWSTKPGHKQKNHELTSGDYHFELYLRQNLFDTDDFSCGLSVFKPDGTVLTLTRYNGSAHPHGAIKYECHIHLATAAAIAAGAKPESHADVTTRYTTLEEALNCMAADCNITGLESRHFDPPSLTLFEP